MRKLYARMEDNHHLTTKSKMFINLRRFYRQQGRCVFKENVFPLTFYLQGGKISEDIEYHALLRYYRNNPTEIFIVKPGENSNRGNGITICDSLKALQSDLQSRQSRPTIIQQYIKNPMLIDKRKFDIRIFGLLSTVYGTMRGFFYEEGYLRTSSKEFSLNDPENRLVHLTNDAVQ